jgi:hypothetical protein
MASLYREQDYSAHRMLTQANVRVGDTVKVVLGLGLASAGLIAFCPGILRVLRLTASGDPADHKKLIGGEIVFRHAKKVRRAIGDRTGILLCNATIRVTDGLITIAIDIDSIRIVESKSVIRFESERPLVENALNALCV